MRLTLAFGNARRTARTVDPTPTPRAFAPPVMVIWVARSRGLKNSTEPRSGARSFATRRLGPATSQPDRRRPIRCSLRRPWDVRPSLTRPTPCFVIFGAAASASGTAVAPMSAVTARSVRRFMSAKLSEMEPLDIPTSAGPARAHFVAGERAAVVLGHGAGGGVGAPDLLAAADAATAAGCAVALVEQPYRVAGRRSSPRPTVLDAAWVEVVERLPLDGLALIAGGRSAGARVACRTAAATGAVAVLCLAFPLQPPRGGPNRQGELDAVSVPTLVVQ